MDSQTKILPLIMPDKTNDYRLYLDERFNNINTLVNAHFQTINDRLDRIEAQTTKTNGRVNSLEDKVVNIKTELITHPINCPNAKDIKSIQTALGDYYFIQKYPKLFTGLIVAAVFIALLALKVSLA